MMLNFTHAFTKMDSAGNDDAAVLLDGLLLSDETVHAAFRNARDCVVFTDRRIVAVVAQGMTGKKRDRTSIPYSQVSAYSVETAAGSDTVNALELWLGGLGWYGIMSASGGPCRLLLEFLPTADVHDLGRFIAERIL